MLEAKLAFLHLKQASTEALIFHYFNPKYYNQMKINAFGYTINNILS